MKRQARYLMMSALLALPAVAGMARVAAGQPRAAYPHMAPLSSYLMADRAAEIALARSAAPPSVSDKARILVLGPHGYSTAVEGSNGFVCVVERSWMSQFDFPEFWNPKMRGPDCYNPQAAQSVLPILFLRTKLALAGESRAGIKQGVEAALAAKTLPPLLPGAMSYMMSKQGYLNDEAGHWLPHLMIYVPPATDWGADLPGSTVMLSPQFDGKPEPIRLFLVPVGRWSDGTAAPVR